jgi:hypothetical protein
MPRQRLAESEVEIRFKLLDANERNWRRRDEKRMDSSWNGSG